MIVIRAQYGLGDNLYLRPVLKHLPRKDIYLITPWPQVYHDMPWVKCCRPNDNYLRTQKDNIHAIKNWHTPPHLPDYYMTYSLDVGTIQFNHCKILLQRQPTWLDNEFSIKESWIQAAAKLLGTKVLRNGKKICLVRPNTLRREWMCEARNPKTQYLQRFIDTYKECYYFISCANLKDNEEWYEEKLKNIDIELLNLPIEIVFGLFYLSDLILTSPSFWTALGPMIQRPMIAIYGAHEPHSFINDKRCTHQNLTVIEPNPFDRCNLHKKNAYKDISDEILLTKFKEARANAKHS